MSQLAPEGKVYQAGTLSGNPLAMAAGLKTLQIFFQERVMEKIDSLSRFLEKGFKKLKRKYPHISFNALGGMFSLFFTSKTPQNFADVQSCDLQMFGRFFNFMLEQGIFIPPSQFEANFLSMTYTEENIAEYLQNTQKFLKENT